jgi:hypothetical protein
LRVDEEGERGEDESTDTRDALDGYAERGKGSSPSRKVGDMTTTIVFQPATKLSVEDTVEEAIARTVAMLSEEGERSKIKSEI